MDQIRTGVEWLDRTVIDEAQADRSLAGMGTTLTSAISIGADLLVIHVGDSRAYLFHDGHLEQLTCDHTVTQMLIDGGLLRQGVDSTLRGGIGRPTFEASERLHRGHIDH